MFDSLIDTVKGWIASFVEFMLWRILYWIEVLIVRFVGFMEDIMEIFTGEKAVTYNGKSNYLINIFFEHKAVRGIYGGIALIGIVFCFVFAIVSVIRKSLDLRDKQQGVTHGVILANLLKSILIISSMNLIMLVALETTNTLIKQVTYVVQNGEGLAQGPATITFTNEQYAAMGRIINTLGNYSLNPSYKSRYNLNACYNDIRGDLKYLGDQGVFNYHYVTKVNGEEIYTWQCLMEKLATAYDYETEAPLDNYDDGLTNAILDCMEIFKANPTMEVLKSYTREAVEAKDTTVPMDRILFLSGTMGVMDGVAAARNPRYNKDPSFFDNARLPYYLGEDGADIYSYSDVRKTFDPSPFATNYPLVWFSSIAILKEMLVLIVTCSVRIFNLLALYIAAPLAIATMPMDDGGKFKQWTTAFIVQLLTIVGMVLAMRLFLMFIPIIWSPALKTSSNPILDVIIKMVIQYGAVLSVNKVNGIFTGILADNAGFQAITAGDVRSNVENSSAGKMLGGMSAGNLAEKGFNKGRQQLGKQVGKVSSKAAYAMDALGITEGAYEGSKKKQQKDSDKAQQNVRKNQRQAKALEADTKSLKETGRHLNGSKPKNKAEAVKKQERALQYMKKNNVNFKDAMRMAEIDAKEDRLDNIQQGNIEAMKLKNPPPKREPHGGQGGDGPGNQQNQNNQVPLMAPQDNNDVGPVPAPEINQPGPNINPQMNNANPQVNDQPLNQPNQNQQVPPQMNYQQVPPQMNNPLMNNVNPQMNNQPLNQPNQNQQVPPQMNNQQVPPQINPQINNMNQPQNNNPINQNNQNNQV